MMNAREVMARAIRDRIAMDGQSAREAADAALSALEAAGMAIVPVEELAELRQRMPWTGGQSPTVCGAMGGVARNARIAAAKDQTDAN